MKEEFTGLLKCNMSKMIPFTHKSLSFIMHNYLISKKSGYDL